MGLERREGLGGDEIKVRDCRKGQVPGALSQCRKSCWENQEWYLTISVLALRRLMQDFCEFKTSLLGYIVSSRQFEIQSKTLSKKKKKRRKRGEG